MRAAPSLGIYRFTTPTTPNIYNVMVPTGSGSVTGTGGGSGDTTGYAALLNGKNGWTGGFSCGSGGGGSSSCCKDMEMIDGYVVRLTSILTQLTGRGDIQTADQRLDVMTQTITDQLSKL